MTRASQEVPGSRPESCSNKIVVSPALSNLLMDHYMKVLWEEENEKRAKPQKEAALLPCHKPHDYLIRIANNYIETNMIM